MFAPVLLLALLTPHAFGAITIDFNCTDGTNYLPTAVSCSNAVSDAACEALYALNTGVTAYPAAGTADQRPNACFSADGGLKFNEEMQGRAADSCPKTCGLCCKNSAYDCSNVQFPRLKCNDIQVSQCKSPAWRTIIAQDCPSACGFCGEGGCVDAVTNCATDISICQNIGMQDFVNTYCQKTCQRCPSTTTVSSGGNNGGSCTSYATDSSSACSAWAANGFCTNTFYTYAQRKARCATTCRLC